MRADLVRAHNGEPPEAPKVFTNAERSSLLSSTAATPGGPPPVPMPGQAVGDPDPDRGGGSVGRWVVAVAVLAVLTIVVVIGFNTFRGRHPEVPGPQKRGQTSPDA